MEANRPRILVLGTGFGSFSFIKHIDVEAFDVFVVSPRNHFLFTPLLPSTTVGTVEFRSIIEPIRVARKGIRFYQAVCTRLDLEKSIAYGEGYFHRTPFEHAYDFLVLGVGAVNNTFGIPGVAEHAMFLKELADARAIRQKIIECLERASKPGRAPADLDWLLRFVVVGGGPTGVEFAAEMHDFLREDLAKWFPDLVPHVRITVLEAKEQILNMFDARLRAYATRVFRRSQIDVRTNSMVREVRQDAIVLQNGEEIRYGLVVWSTGIGPTPLVRSLDVPKGPFKRLLVDDYLKVLTTTNVYAMGDCCRLESQDLPPTAQVAQQEGKYLARAFNQRARGKTPGPFVYKHMGMLAYIGERRALADLKNVKGRGFTTWLFWRSAYLTKLVSWKNKLLVVSDWLLTSLFGRDISRF
ncbi:MAG: FAD-dependent oxidoreductase [Candidatus Hydrogenedentes bacterium]|nr:FAD-dependent oxidoreductase [Candidatus Hydrogenedentota bacterium]